MLAVNINQQPEADLMNTFTTLPLKAEIQPDRELNELLVDLSPDTSRVTGKLPKKLGT